MSARSNKSDVTGERQINPRIFSQCKVLQTNTVEADSMCDGTDSSHLNQKDIRMLDVRQLSGKNTSPYPNSKLEKGIVGISGMKFQSKLMADLSANGESETERVSISAPEMKTSYQKKIDRRKC